MVPYLHPEVAEPRLFFEIFFFFFDGLLVSVGGFFFNLFSAVVGLLASVKGVTSSSVV